MRVDRPDVIDETKHLILRLMLIRIAQALENIQSQQPVEAAKIAIQSRLAEPKKLTSQFVQKILNNENLNLEKSKLKNFKNVIKRLDRNVTPMQLATLANLPGMLVIKVDSKQHKGLIDRVNVSLTEAIEAAENVHSKLPSEGGIRRKVSIVAPLPSQAKRVNAEPTWISSDPDIKSLTPLILNLIPITLYNILTALEMRYGDHAPVQKEITQLQERLHMLISADCHETIDDITRSALEVRALIDRWFDEELQDSIDLYLTKVGAFLEVLMRIRKGQLDLRFIKIILCRLGLIRNIDGEELAFNLRVVIENALQIAREERMNPQILSEFGLALPENADTARDMTNAESRLFGNFEIGVDAAQSEVANLLPEKLEQPQITQPVESVEDSDSESSQSTVAPNIESHVNPIDVADRHEQPNVEATPPLDDPVDDARSDDEPDAQQSEKNSPLREDEVKLLIGNLYVELAFTEQGENYQRLLELINYLRNEYIPAEERTCGLGEGRRISVFDPTTGIKWVTLDGNEPSPGEETSINLETLIIVFESFIDHAMTSVDDFHNQALVEGKREELEALKEVIALDFSTNSLSIDGFDKILQKLSMILSSVSTSLCKNICELHIPTLQTALKKLQQQLTKNMLSFDATSSDESLLYASAEFFESKRLDLLELLRKARVHLEDEEGFLPEGLGKFYSQYECALRVKNTSFYSIESYRKIANRLWVELQEHDKDALHELAIQLMKLMADLNSQSLKDHMLELYGLVKNSIGVAQLFASAVDSNILEKLQGLSKGIISCYKSGNISLGQLQKIAQELQALLTETLLPGFEIIMSQLSVILEMSEDSNIDTAMYELSQMLYAATIDMRLFSSGYHTEHKKLIEKAVDMKNKRDSNDLSIYDLQTIMCKIKEILVDVNIDSCNMMVTKSLDELSDRIDDKSNLKRFVDKIKAIIDKAQKQYTQYDESSDSESEVSTKYNYPSSDDEPLSDDFLCDELSESESSSEDSSSQTGLDSESEDEVSSECESIQSASESGHEADGAIKQPPTLGETIPEQFQLLKQKLMTYEGELTVAFLQSTLENLGNIIGQSRIDSATIDQHFTDVKNELDGFIGAQLQVALESAAEKESVKDAVQAVELEQQKQDANTIWYIRRNREAMEEGEIATTDFLLQRLIMDATIERDMTIDAVRQLIQHSLANRRHAFARTDDSAVREAPDVDIELMAGQLLSMISEDGHGSRALSIANDPDNSNVANVASALAGLFGNQSDSPVQDFMEDSAATEDGSDLALQGGSRR